MAEARSAEAAVGVESVVSSFRDKVCELDFKLTEERDSVDNEVVFVASELERLEAKLRARRGEADVGTTDDRAATVPIRRHHKRSSARCTSPQSVSSRRTVLRCDAS